MEEEATFNNTAQEFSADKMWEAMRDLKSCPAVPEAYTLSKAMFDQLSELATVEDDTVKHNAFMGVKIKTAELLEDHLMIIEYRHKTTIYNMLTGFESENIMPEYFRDFEMPSPRTTILVEKKERKTNT